MNRELYKGLFNEKTTTYFSDITFKQPYPSD